MKVIGYVRVSTLDQAQDGVSLDMQHAKIAAYADLNGATLVEIISDAGLSGKSANRPGLVRALELVKQHRGTLVVYSMSRLSRSTRDTLEIVERLDASGCEFASLTEKIDTSSAGGRVIFRVLAALAEFEREQLAERVTAAMQHCKKQGRVVGSVPHGFSRNGATLELNADEQAVKDTARVMRESGATLRQISAALAERGAFNRAGRPFNPKSVASLLAA